jgi:hypothetical protein
MALKLLKLSTLYQDLQIRIQLYAELVRLEKSFLFGMGFCIHPTSWWQVMIVLRSENDGKNPGNPRKLRLSSGRDDGVSRWNSPPSASNHHIPYLQRVGSKGGTKLLRWWYHGLPCLSLGPYYNIKINMKIKYTCQRIIILREQELQETNVYQDNIQLSNLLQN